MKAGSFVLIALIGFIWSLLWYDNVRHIATQILRLNTVDFIKNVSIESSYVFSWTDHFEAHLVEIEPGYIDSFFAGRDYESFICGKYVSNGHWYRNLAVKQPFEVTGCYSAGDIYGDHGLVSLYTNRSEGKAVINYFCC